MGHNRVGMGIAYVCGTMKILIDSETERLNEALEAFDRLTEGAFDEVTDLHTLAELAFERGATNLSDRLFELSLAGKMEASLRR